MIFLRKAHTYLGKNTPRYLKKLKFKVNFCYLSKIATLIYLFKIDLGASMTLLATKKYESLLC